MSSHLRPDDPPSFKETTTSTSDNVVVSNESKQHYKESATLTLHFKHDDDFGAVHINKEPTSTISYDGDKREFHPKQNINPITQTKHLKPVKSTTLYPITSQHEKINHLLDGETAERAATPFHPIQADRRERLFSVAAKKQKTQENSSNHHSGDSSFQETSDNNREENEKQKKKVAHNDHQTEKKQSNDNLDHRLVRSAKLCFTIVISFMVCWTPHALHDILKITNTAPSIIYSDSILARGTLFVAFFNGIVDPIIYVLMNRELKEHFEKFYRFIVRGVASNKINAVQGPV